MSEEQKVDNQEKTENQEKDKIDEAKEILLEMKKERELLQKEREKIEKATAEMLLSGKGAVLQKQIKKEETDEEYSERIRRGEI